MPVVKLPYPDISGDPSNSILMLQDTIIKYRKELMFILANLDSDNLSSTIINNLGGGKPAKAITFYVDGFVVTREDDSVEDWDFELNGDGFIVQLINNTESTAIPITWAGTPKP